MQTNYTHIAQLVDAIVASGRSITSAHTDYVNRSFELAELGEAGRALYHKLAQMDGQGYNARQTDYNFTYALRHPGTRHLASLIHQAKEVGITMPHRLSTSRPSPFAFSPHRLSPSHPSPQPMLPTELVQQYRSNSSLLCQALMQTDLLTYDQMQQVADRYRLGALSTGEVIFWLIDADGHVADGKVMLYLPNGHRNKDKGARWMSRLLKLPGSRQLLFGQHLVADNTVAIVESEKTALIMAARMPQYTWLASGGMGMLTADKLMPLLGHDVMLYPDTDTTGEAYHRWYNIANEAAQRGVHVGISSILEQGATNQQKEQKIDIADLL